jgi:hypothetical protein
MSACPRLWEAEAVEDGRLDGAGRASFERHASACAECALEVELLGKLRTVERLPFVPRSTMSRRRRRAHLLRRANEQILGSTRRMWRGRTGAIAIALVAAGVVLALWRGWQRPLHSTRPEDAPLFEITSVNEARWKVVHEGPNAEVALSFGAVLVHVEKLGLERRFVMTLPDGEVEVRGTRFSVEADERHTKRVAVSEGLVALRVANDIERTLYAGESWTAPEPTTASGAAAVDVPSAPAAVAAEHRDGEKRTPVARAGKRKISGTDSRKAPSRAIAPVDTAAAGVADDGGAGALFADAVRAFESGSYAKADDLFRRFEKQFSSDPRAEDASFLRIVCALRRGDRGAAESHAHEYLGAYPEGLRRQDVERLFY